MNREERKKKLLNKQKSSTFQLVILAHQINTTYCHKKK